MHKEIRELFKEFQEMPKKALIDRPEEFIWVYSDFIVTRRILKHLAEKGDEGWRLLQLVPDVLEFPDLILRAKRDRRIFVKFIPEIKGEPYAAVIEMDNIIVTVFGTDKKYLKNFEILWRTGTSLV